MIKRLFITFLAVLYLGVSSGATLHYQYCMGKLIKVALWHGHAKKCHTCGMELKEKASKKCCTDKHQELKSEKSRSLSHSDVTSITGAALQVNYSFNDISYTYTSTAVKYPVAQAPPDGKSVPLFLRNCTFLI